MRTPNGNLNVLVLNEFDQFVKHKLKAKYYFRYADNFAILSGSKNCLKRNIKRVRTFLCDKLGLELHPQKVFVKTSASGVDFLGGAHFPNYRILRTTTKRRMIKRIQKHPKSETLNSYLGLLRHGNTHNIKQQVAKEYILRQDV